jgi:hypothetical protein
MLPGKVLAKSSVTAGGSCAETETLDGPQATAVKPMSRTLCIVAIMANNPCSYEYGAGCVGPFAKCEGLSGEP